MDNTLNLPMVSIEKMNVVHLEEASLLEALMKSIASGDSDTTVERAFASLIEHVVSHFSFEETMMREHGYPLYRLHKGEHDKILAQLRLLAMDFRTRKDRIRLYEYCSQEMIAWLDQHIKAMDSVMADALKPYRQEDSIYD